MPAGLTDGENSVRTGYALAALGSAMVPFGPLLAQEEDVQGRTVYPSSFFSQFSPANAFQMVERLPGFSLDSGSSEVRGFGQAAGNVVINGQRPSSKSDGLQSILSRIPASRVVRIEIASGNSFGSDYAGKPQVANVVLTDDSGLSGTIDGQISREYTGRLLPRLSASLSLKRGPSTFSASFTYQMFSISEEGSDLLEALPDHGALERRAVVLRNSEPFKTLSLGWALEEGESRSAHLNTKVTIDAWTLDQDITARPVTGAAHDDRYHERHIWRPFELSGDITRPLAGGAIKLNLLATHRYRTNYDTLLQRDASDASLLGGFYQAFLDWRDERVARVAWSHGNIAGWTIELGAEGAYNKLRSNLDLFGIDPDGNQDKIDLPIDDAIVREYRAETFVNAGRGLAPGLRLDLGLNYEASRLTVSGDASARRTLKYLKPKASLDWSSGGWHSQLSLRRTVAQLNFTDFVSAASFTDNQVDGGNAELVPQRSWELLLSADRAVLGDGRVKLELGHNWIQQVQDRVPVEGGFDAPGNLGNGESWIMKGNLDLPLARFGFKGARLSLTGSYVDTSVTDPYTFEERPFSGNSLFYYTGELRQDLGKFAWGLAMSGNTGSTFYRFRETDTSQGISPQVSAFAEYRPTVRTTVTLTVDNLLDGQTRRERLFFDPDRSKSTPFQREYRERSAHRSISLSVKHSIG